MLYALEMLEGMRRAMLCNAEVVEAMRCAVLCMLEAAEGGLCCWRMLDAFDGAWRWR